MLVRSLLALLLTFAPGVLPAVATAGAPGSCGCGDFSPEPTASCCAAPIVVTERCCGADAADGAGPLANCGTGGCDAGTCCGTGDDGCAGACGCGCIGAPVHHDPASPASVRPLQERPGPPVAMLATTIRVPDSARADGVRLARPPDRSPSGRELLIRHGFLRL